ncbi:MAG: acyltransferase, partial [Lachnospiraceae bacterium]|nr:acyltransferase [Lachnospiraceae bacterium]
TYKKLFSKYIFLVAVALLIFTVLYRVYDIVLNGEAFTAAGFFKGFVNFFTGGSWSHLWYLYMLIGLYLLMPFFKKITEHITIKELGYFLLLAVVFLSLVPILKLWNIGIGFGIPIASIYPFYLFCGYSISRPEVKISKWVAVVCLILSSAAQVVLTLLRWQNYETMENLEMFFNYSSIIVILQAVSIFYLFAKKLPKAEAVVAEAPSAVEEKPAVVEETVEPVDAEKKEKNEKKENWFKKLILSFDKCTFGVYLVHMFLARFVLRYMGLNPYDSIPAFIGLILATIVVSYLVVWLLRKIPKVDKVL